MTVGFWVLLGLLALVGIGITIICFLSDAPVGGVITLLITVIVLGGLLWFGSWYYSNTASGARAVKDQQLDWSQGVERIIQVVDEKQGCTGAASIILIAHGRKILFTKQGSVAAGGKSGQFPPVVAGREPFALRIIMELIQFALQALIEIGIRPCHIALKNDDFLIIAQRQIVQGRRIVTRQMLHGFPRRLVPPARLGKKPLEGQRFFLQPVRACLFQQMPQMIQPHGAFQTMALSAAAETLRASGNLHVPDFADQRVPAIEDMTALHHAGANAPSRKKRQKAAMGKLFFIQKHRPPAGLARVIHQENQRLRENLL